MVATPTLTPHQADVLRSLGRRIRGHELVRGSDIGSPTALLHLVRKGYARTVTDHGPRGGSIRWYGLTDLGRQTLERQSKAPQAVRDYFGDTARPVVSRVFTDQWRNTGWTGQHITAGLVRELRRARVTVVALSWQGRVADFQVKEL